MTIWPATKIINGRPRHPQSQGLVERGNSVLKTKLGKWMEDNNRNDWSFGLKIVIYGMNTSVSRPTKSTPYCLAFGTEPKNNDSILNTLFSNGYVDEENIPENVIIEGNICYKF